MADWADKASDQANRQGHRKVDALLGMNIEREYALIKAGTSKRHPRIQDLIVQRRELGQ